MSARNSRKNINALLNELRDMELHDGKDMRKYAKTANSILAQLQQEFDAAYGELKVKLTKINPRSVEFSNKAQAIWYGNLVARHLSKAADRLESAQKATIKMVSAYEKYFSEDAIEERREARLRKEAEEKRKAKG